MNDAKQRRDLVIRSRLDALKANLAQVKDVLSLAGGRGAEIGNLEAAFKDAELGLVNMAETALDEVRLARIFVRRPEKHQQQIESSLGKAEQLLVDLQSKVKESAGIVDTLIKKRVNFGPTVLDELKEHATHGEEEFEALAERLKRGELEALWKDYPIFFQQQGQPLFVDYVDFLRGLAMREAGLEAGICQHLDLLLDDPQRWGMDWRCLVIPDQRRPEIGGAGRLVRLGFPEWTIWALPLAAKSLGQILAADREYLRQEVDELAKKLPAGVGRQHLVDCLADAYGTYSMGPAYACAAILLQLDPAPHPEAGRRSLDWDRAATIFEMWRRAAQKARPVNFGTELREQLLAEWRAAVQQASQAAASAAEVEPAGSAAAAAMPADAGGGPAEAEEVPPHVQVWCERWWSVLEKYAGAGEYTGDAWNTKAYELAQVLVEDGPAIEARDKDKDLRHVLNKDLRHVLNAAWICRVQHAAEPELIPEIAKAALDLWGEIQKSPAAQKGVFGQATDPQAARELHQAARVKAES